MIRSWKCSTIDRICLIYKQRYRDLIFYLFRLNFEIVQIVWYFYCSFLLLHLDKYREERDWIQLTCLTLPHLC
jgi:hypothetical protein